jgi:hypothetical protein
MPDGAAAPVGDDLVRFCAVLASPPSYVGAAQAICSRS